MQQFQVPQFIDVEDKIFGPLTTKQFFYLLGGGGLSFLFWFFFKFYIFIVLAAPVVALAVSLAFLKVNGRPFIDLVANYLSYVTKPRLFLWKKSKKKLTASEVGAHINNTQVPKVTKNKLNDLAWSLGINKSIKR